MKKVLSNMSLVLLCVTFLFSNVQKVYATDSSEVTKRLSTDIEKVNDLVGYIDNTNDTGDSIISKLGEYNSYFVSSASFYQLNSDKVDSSLVTVCKNANKAVTAISQNIILMETGVSEGSESKLNTAIEGLNQGIDSLNSAVKQHDEALGLTDYGPYYIFLSILFGVVSIVLLGKSRVKVIGEATKAKKEIMIALFKSSLWPTIAALITTIWYYATPPGSTYYILWGPVLFGSFYFLKAIWQYSSQSRKIINEAVKEENNYAEELERQEEEEKEEKWRQFETRYCSKCGKRINQNEKFCANCGVKVNG